MVQYNTLYYSTLQYNTVRYSRQYNSGTDVTGQVTWQYKQSLAVQYTTVTTVHYNSVPQYTTTLQ